MRRVSKPAERLWLFAAWPVPTVLVSHCALQPRSCGETERGEATLMEALAGHTCDAIPVTESGMCQTRLPSYWLHLAVAARAALTFDAPASVLKEYIPLAMQKPSPELEMKGSFICRGACVGRLSPFPGSSEVLPCPLKPGCRMELVVPGGAVQLHSIFPHWCPGIT